MDRIDKAIMAILQRDFSTPVSEIAESVGLSQTPCWRRIKKLEEDGFIRARVALAEPETLNLRLTAFVMVKTAQHNEAWLKKFAEAVRRIPEVIELHRMSGETDYLMKVVCPDMERFDKVYKKLISAADFSDVRSSFSMETLKTTTELPLDYA
ncbi:Lrp/AsnC family transcriptional regulator [Hyphococcus flavus]|uniref:Lrp/AsnC family transcriptional regulator n=1 Tax=Hyphococcus flavus TaxID=1866326 RepID=A0AAF0CG24_9PROT|nr:Lrp/AsnC family transcriptional regulator [Hyphococcus flavus]WDI33026.1 Lrp/AsnC family transcriptional regulator [Hyphococcus flavus]